MLNYKQIWHGIKPIRWLNKFNLTISLSAESKKDKQYDDPGKPMKLSSFKLKNWGGFNLNNLQRNKFTI